MKLDGFILFLLIGLAPSPGRAADRVTFRNDVMAVLSKAGCNRGTCHGNATGKGGFQLSLRGYDPAGDYVVLTRELSGRRANVAQPDASLLLLKPTMQVPHEGGRRFERDSEEYRILRAWIAEGMPADPAGTPTLTGLEVSPREKIVISPQRGVDLSVTAAFSNGERRDVTGMAVYEPSQPFVEISKNGRVNRLRDGEVTVAVRYLDQHAPVRLAFIPDRPDFAWTGPPPRNDIDREIFAKLQSLTINPSPLCDDTTFLRRAYLDLLGLLPTADEARRFIANDSSQKRPALIEQLMQRGEFAEFWALKWSDLLRNEEKTLDRKGVENFHHWLVVQFEQNRPLNEFAREIVAARGSTYANPPANYYRAMRDPVMRAESAAQVFLGVRLQCAKCHNHPFDRWTQDDYYSWTNLFARVDYKILENNRRDSNDKHEFVGEQIVFMKPTGDVDDPRTGRPLPPRVLGDDAEPLPHEADRLQYLADWIAHPDNPFFARAQVNRIWFHLMGRGIVDPIDDFRATSPPSHPELLDRLAEDFVEQGYDMRHVIRTIMNSAAYQLATHPNETNADDEINYSHVGLRRLTAEQLLDGICRAAGGDVTFAGYPPGLRAAQIPGVRAVRGRRSAAGSGDAFLTLFGKPQRLQACECERSDSSTLAQTFQMISGELLQELLERGDNRISAWLQEKLPDDAIVEEAYWTTLSRAPSGEESSAAVAYLGGAQDRRRAIEDLLWSLLNSAEFVLRP